MVVGAIILATLALIQPPNIEDLEWLSGRWRADEMSVPEEVRYTEEVWIKANADTMFGFSRTMRMRDTESFEYLRIREEGRTGLVLIAQPNGGDPVRFQMTSYAPGEIVFENRSHDYPQRVRYKRTDDRLQATISLIDGSNPNTWDYRLERSEP